MPGWWLTEMQCHLPTVTVILCQQEAAVGASIIVAQPPQLQSPGGAIVCHQLGTVPVGRVAMGLTLPLAADHCSGVCGAHGAILEMPAHDLQLAQGGTSRGHPRVTLAPSMALTCTCPQ